MSTFQRLVDEAISYARLSPCKKSRRGVVIFNEYHEILVADLNKRDPVLLFGSKDLVCDGSEACKAGCRDLTVHAEQAAILQAARECIPLYGTRMLHVKIDEANQLVAGGPPSCPQCSKLILRSGIETMWLYEARPNRPRWVSYSADKFHDQTLRNCKLHPYHEG